MGWSRSCHAVRFGVAVLLAMAALLAGSGCTDTGGTQDTRGERGGVISFGPNITEVVFALGQGDRVVAVSSFCDYPPEIQSREKVGGLFDPDLEKITRLAPDLIIVQGKHEKVAELAERNSTSILHVNMDSIQTICDGVTAIGEKLGCPDRAGELVEEIREGLESVRAEMAGLDRPKVLILTGRQLHEMGNLYTVGGGSFMSELVDIAGGDNIYKDSEQAYTEVSKETVLVRAPDVILEFHAGEDLSEEDKLRYLADWQAIPSLPAVKNDRIYLITESYSMRPGPRAPMLARQLAELLHPEAELAEK